MGISDILSLETAMYFLKLCVCFFGITLCIYLIATMIIITYGNWYRLRIKKIILDEMASRIIGESVMNPSRRQMKTISRAIEKAVENGNVTILKSEKEENDNGDDE